MARTVKITPDRPLVKLSNLEQIDAEALSADGYHDYVSLSGSSLDGRKLEGLRLSDSKLRRL